MCVLRRISFGRSTCSMGLTSLTPGSPRRFLSAACVVRNNADRFVDLRVSYLGKASASPPSTGSVAPVVGVALLAKKTTALPTCRPVTRAFSRLRLR